jgi:hypothetical protein
VEAGFRSDLYIAFVSGYGNDEKSEMFIPVFSTFLVPQSLLSSFLAPQTLLSTFLVPQTLFSTFLVPQTLLLTFLVPQIPSQHFWCHRPSS